MVKNLGHHISSTHMDLVLHKTSFFSSGLSPALVIMHEKTYLHLLQNKQRKKRGWVNSLCKYHLVLSSSGNAGISPQLCVALESSKWLLLQKCVSWKVNSFCSYLVFVTSFHIYFHHFLKFIYLTNIYMFTTEHGTEEMLCPTGYFAVFNYN